MCGYMQVPRVWLPALVTKMVVVVVRGRAEAVAAPRAGRASGSWRTAGKTEGGGVAPSTVRTTEQRLNFNYDYFLIKK